jgi:hypothetical protein
MEKPGLKRFLIIVLLIVIAVAVAILLSPKVFGPDVAGGNGNPCRECLNRTLVSGRTMLGASGQAYFCLCCTNNCCFKDKEDR